MILASVRARCKLTYPTGHRQFTTGLNPTAKARIWAEIGVLQLARSYSMSKFTGLNDREWAVMELGAANESSRKMRYFVVTEEVSINDGKRTDSMRSQEFFTN